MSRMPFPAGIAAFAATLALTASANAQQPSFATFGSGCPGSNGTPTLDACMQSSTALGHRLCVTLGNLPPAVGDPAFVMIAARTPVPVDLSVLGMPGCTLEIQPFLSEPARKSGTTATWNLPITNDPSQVGFTLHLQGFVVDRPFGSSWPNALGATVTNAATGVVGLPRTIVETFDSLTQFDHTVSSASWGGGVLAPGAVGGAGIHGEFDVGLLQQVATNEFVWDTDTPIKVPSANTLLDRGDLQIVDGQAQFSRLVVPAGTTVRFTGSRAPVLRVSGSATIDGTLSVSGSTGGLVSSATPLNRSGGTGGLGGAGGGAGGRGAEAWLPTLSGLPPFSTPTAANAGADGATISAPANSGYAGLVAGTGGSGAPWFPASGLFADVNERVNLFYSSQQISGGGGGGFLEPGQDGAITTLFRLPTDPPDDTAPPALGGVSVPFVTAPPGVSSLDHYLVAGSGGGGGGSTASLIRKSIRVSQWNLWTNGHGGGGGAGALGLRVGRQCVVTSGGVMAATGGESRSHQLGTWTDRGTYPGGGGSGGSLLIQANDGLLQNGTIDVRGGAGGTWTGAAPNGRQGASVGGDGAPGYVRVEVPNPAALQLGSVQGITAGANNQGVLQDTDTTTVARSNWYTLGAATATPLSYELDVSLGGFPQTYTDNPGAPNPANVPGAPVRILLQGAVLSPGQVVLASSPWSDTAAALAGQGYTSFRYIVFVDTTISRSIAVEEFRLNVVD